MKWKRNQIESTKPIVKLFACCVADSEWQTVNIVGHLRSEGFSNKEISLLFPKSGEKNFELAATILECAVGGFLAVNSSQLGLSLVAGPIGAVLPHVPSDVDGLGFLLCAFGFSKTRARDYSYLLADAKALIGVHADELDRAKQAEHIFFNSGAKEIAYCGNLAVATDSSNKIEISV